MSTQKSVNWSGARPGLFDPITIGSLTLENRSVRSATFIGLPGLNHMQAGFALEAILPHVRTFLAGV